MEGKDVRIPINVGYKVMNAIFDKEKIRNRLDEILNTESYRSYYEEMLEDIELIKDAIRTDENKDVVNNVFSKKAIDDSIKLSIMMDSLSEAIEELAKNDNIDIVEVIISTLTEEFVLSSVIAIKEVVMQNAQVVSAAKSEVEPELDIWLDNPDEKKYYS